MPPRKRAAVADEAAEITPETPPEPTLCGAANWDDPNVICTETVDETGRHVSDHLNVDAGVAWNDDDIPVYRYAGDLEVTAQFAAVQVDVEAANVTDLDAIDALHEAAAREIGEMYQEMLTELRQFTLSNAVTA